MQYDLMKARHNDLMRSAEQHRLATQAKAARVQAPRQARGGEVEAAPMQRVLRLVWRLRPA